MTTQYKKPVAYAMSLIEAGDTQSFQSYLKTNRSVKWRKELGPLLQKSCECGQLELLKYLLSSYAHQSIEVQQKYLQLSACFFASIQNNHFDVFLFLTSTYKQQVTNHLECHLFRKALIEQKDVRFVYQIPEIIDKLGHNDIETILQKENSYDVFFTYNNPALVLPLVKKIIDISTETNNYNLINVVKSIDQHIGHRHPYIIYDIVFHSFRQSKNDLVQSFICYSFSDKSINEILKTTQNIPTFFSSYDRNKLKTLVEDSVILRQQLILKDTLMVELNNATPRKRKM